MIDWISGAVLVAIGVGLDRLMLSARWARARKYEAICRREMISKGLRED